MFAVGFDIEFILYNNSNKRVAFLNETEYICDYLNKNDNISCHVDVNNIEFTIPPIELTNKKNFRNHLSNYFYEIQNALSSYKEGKYYIIPYSNAYHSVGGHIHISSNSDFLHPDDIEDVEDILLDVKRMCSRSSRVNYNTQMIRNQSDGIYRHKYYYEFRPLESYVLYEHPDIAYELVQCIVNNDYREIDNISNELRKINQSIKYVFKAEFMNKYLPFVPEKCMPLKRERNIIEQYKYYDIDRLLKEYINTLPDKEITPYPCAEIDYYYYNITNNQIQKDDKNNPIDRI